MMIRIHKDKYILEGFKVWENEYSYVIKNNTLKSKKISLMNKEKIHYNLTVV